MTTVMTPVCLFLLFLSVTAAPWSAIETEELESESTIEGIERANQNLTTILRDGDIMPNTRRNALLCSFKGCRWPKSRNGRVYVPYLISSSYTTILQDGNIMPNRQRNALRCRGRTCRWPRSGGGKVYVPYVISSSYTRDETIIIVNALNSFMTDTCVTFVMKTWQWDYLDFFPGSGCWSFLGHTGGRQLISLEQGSCVYKDTVQHEALHALGFHHEQVRSDRDRYISILTQNIRPGAERNFQKKNTNNLGTGYDFNSIMHYSKYAFSKNGQPTIVAKRNPDQVLGKAKEMSQTDILRVNKLYGCSE